jgi:hypothetical protein
MTALRLISGNRSATLPTFVESKRCAKGKIPGKQLFRDVEFWYYFKIETLIYIFARNFRNSAVRNGESGAFLEKRPGPVGIGARRPGERRKAGKDGLLSR